MNSELKPTYILHTRPYSNTSLIIDIFSETHGRLSLLARSARGPQSRYKGQLQLFTPILMSWSGRYELKNLGKCELSGMSHQLQQQSLVCGFYLNELLMRLLHKEDPHPALFHAYHHALQSFEENRLTIALRVFERKLLNELGYGLPFTHIQAEQHYDYRAQQGFQPCAYRDDESIFSGEDLLKISADELHTERVLKAAKRLMRLALAPLLGGKPLYSRELL